MGFDKGAYDNSCHGSGHAIQVYKTNENMVDMKNGSSPFVVPVFSVFCSKCGMSLEEIREQTKTRRPRKAKNDVTSTESN